MPQGILSVWHDEAYELDLSSEDAQRLSARVAEFNQDLESGGALVFVCGLLPASTATVAGPDGTRSDGP